MVVMMRILVMVEMVVMMMMIVAAAIAIVIVMIVTYEVDTDLWEFQSFLGHAASASSMASPFLRR